MGTLSNNRNDKIETDVLVIGGGLAGCRAALRARDFVTKVTLVDKAIVARSGATLWCHEILAPVPADTYYSWMREMVEYTEFFCDQESTEILFHEAGQRLKEMEDWGVPFKKDSGGDYIKEPVRGMMDYGRAIFYQGRFWMDRVKEQLSKRGIEVVERIMLTDLLTSDGLHPTRGKVVGAVGFHTLTGEVLTIKAKATVLTTGKMITKLPHSAVDNLTGDGQAMTFRAGAELTGLEFALGGNYYSPLNERAISTMGFVQFQNHGAFMVNEQGERIMDKYLSGRMERGSGRGPLAQAFVKEVMEGRGPLYFDMRHWTDERVKLMRAVMPDTMAKLDAAGIDIQKHRIPYIILPDGAYASGDGGVKVGINGETNLPGLFASGAASNIRTQTEAFGSATQANCNVFGYRAGEAAGKMARGTSSVEIDTDQVKRLQDIALSPLSQKKGVSAEDIFRAVNRNLLPWKYGLIKQEKRIREALARIEDVERKLLPQLAAPDVHNLVKANEARSYVQMVKLFHIASLERKESRCKHYREDYPFRDDVDWLKLIVVRRDGEGVRIAHEPIPVESYPIKLDKRTKIPAPVQFSYEPYETRSKV